PDGHVTLVLDHSAGTENHRLNTKAPNTPENGFLQLAACDSDRNVVNEAAVAHRKIEIFSDCQRQYPECKNSGYHVVRFVLDARSDLAGRFRRLSRIGFNVRHSLLRVIEIRFSIADLI